MFVCTYTTSYTLLDDMNEKISRGKLFSDEEFNQILKFLLETLNSMKNQCIIHRGINPSAIFFQKKNDYSSLLLKNFYFSVKTTNGTTRGLTGTLWYSCPEILCDSDQDYKVDLYSAGIVLYQVLTLINPFQNSKSIEDVMKKINENYLELSLRRFPKMGYNKIHIDIVRKMVDGSKNRPSIDDIMSFSDIKEIRINTAKSLIFKISNSLFNLKLNTRILDNFINVLNKTNKKVLGLLYYIFNSLRLLLVDYKQIKKTSILFDFFDVNNNLFVTTDEFSDKLYDLCYDHIDRESKIKKEITKNYVQKYRTIVEAILDNTTNSTDIKQIDFNDFLVIAIMFWFFEEKERKRILKENLLSNDHGYKINNDKDNINNNESLSNTIKSDKKNETIQFEKSQVNFNIMKNSICKDENNSILIKGNKNKDRNKTNSMIKDKNIINEKSNTFGKDFEIDNPNHETNENKLVGFFNCYFQNQDSIPFETFLFDKMNFDIKIFSEIEVYLNKKYMNENIKIFEYDPENKKNFINKENCLKLFQFDFI